MPETIVTEPLNQMLKSIALQKRTGLLRVERFGEKNTEHGEIYFEGGRPVRARTDREGGQEAFQHICGWKRITCSFHGMSRPYPVNTRVLTGSREPQMDTKAPARSQPEGEQQTENLTRLPEVPFAGRETDRFATPSIGRTGVAQTSPLARTAPGENNPANISSIPGNRPLILHGARLEEYTPAPPARPSRATIRWTTHRGPDLNLPFPTPRKPPVTPRLGPLPGEEALPGRAAIFKARATATTAQAIQGLERRERIVFILLDGRRTVENIARLTHQTEYDVEQILVHLAQAGYAQYIQG